MKKCLLLEKDKTCKFPKKYFEQIKHLYVSPFFYHYCANRKKSLGLWSNYSNMRQDTIAQFTLLYIVQFVQTFTLANFEVVQNFLDEIIIEEAI